MSTTTGKSPAAVAVELGQADTALLNENVMNFADAFATLNAPPDQAGIGQRAEIEAKERQSMQRAAATMSKAQAETELSLAKAEAVREKARQDKIDAEQRRLERGRAAAQKEVAALTADMAAAKRKGMAQAELAEKSKLIGKIRSIKREFSVAGSGRRGLGYDWTVDKLEEEYQVVYRQAFADLSTEWLPALLSQGIGMFEKVCTLFVPPERFDARGLSQLYEMQLQTDDKFRQLVKLNSMMAGNVVDDPRYALGLKLAGMAMTQNVINKAGVAFRADQARGKQPAGDASTSSGGDA